VRLADGDTGLARADPEPVYAVLHNPAQARRSRSAGADPADVRGGRPNARIAHAAPGLSPSRRQVSRRSASDFPGTEDSVGSPTRPGRFQTWIDATVDVAGWLRHQSGCERLVVVRNRRRRESSRTRLSLRVPRSTISCCGRCAPVAARTSASSRRSPRLPPAASRDARDAGQARRRRRAGGTSDQLRDRRGDLGGRSGRRRPAALPTAVGVLADRT